MKKLNFKYIYFLAMMNFGAFAMLTPQQAEQNKRDFLIDCEIFQNEYPGIYKISAKDWKTIKEEALRYVSQYVERSKIDFFKIGFRKLISETLVQVKPSDGSDIATKIIINMKDRLDYIFNEYYRYISNRSEALLPYNVAKLDTLVESHFKYARKFRDPAVLALIKGDLNDTLLKRQKERDDCTPEVIEKFMNDPAFQRLGHQPQQLEKQQQQVQQEEAQNIEVNQFQNKFLDDTGISLEELIVKYLELANTPNNPGSVEDVKKALLDTLKKRQDCTAEIIKSVNEMFKGTGNNSQKPQKEQQQQAQQEQPQKKQKQQQQVQQEEAQNIKVNRFQNNALLGLGELNPKEEELLALLIGKQNEERKQLHKELDEGLNEAYVDQQKNSILQFRNHSGEANSIKDNIIKKVKQNEKN
ncbi:hypothetical protein [Holospora curviuscula]|uniref:Uncharacterized protein n=1 Tax=Holospora curviuscula TaxID=1082868 RepID=A0A2S5R8A5_9PROT|nr:hypothetical protein [Holospora curviuscula]PPE03548.1 hypothetical protein HCUR_00975 [Holospora curviuscula]